MGTTANIFHKRTTGAARWYAETHLAGPTRTKTTTGNVQNSATMLVGASPDRVNLTIVNDGTFDFLLTPFSNGAPSTGIRLGANGGNVTLNVTEDFELVTSDWWGISVGGATAFYVQELVADQLLPPEQA